MGKVPTKKLNFIRCQYEYVLIGYPECEELYKLLRSIFTSHKEMHVGNNG